MKKGNVRKQPCIFCPRKDLTQEHIFGKWTASVMPKTYASHNDAVTHGQVFPDGHRVSGPVQTLTREGDPISRRHRVVCKGCNTGWMSRLQDQSKPILRPLITGDDVILDASQQATLANWITMVTMTAEYLTRSTAMIPREEREVFRWKHAAPNNWTILIGRCREEEFTTRYAKHSMHYPWDSGPLLLGVRPLHNIQTTTIVIGHFLCFAFSTYFPADVSIRIPDHIGSRLAAIHPVRDYSSLALTMTAPLSSDDIHTIYDLLPNSFPINPVFHVPLPSNWQKRND